MVGDSVINWKFFLLIAYKILTFDLSLSPSLTAAVKGIKKSHLAEVRALNNPHQVIKMALESICMLIGEPYSDWKSIRQIIMKENFIPTIANFSTEDITDESRAKMKRDYMSQKEYNFETVNHASKACGPLVKWAIAQVLK